MAAPEGRKPLSYPVSDEAREGYREFAAAQRVSAAALCEAIGLALSDLNGRASTAWLKAVVADAQRITDERHWSARE